MLSTLNILYKIYPYHAYYPCLVNGEWTDWGDWQLCNVSCGGGGQWRHRECYGVEHGGDACPGEASQFKTCGMIQCPGKLVYLRPFHV